MKLLQSVGVALPKHRYSSGDIVRAGAQWLGETKEAQLFCRFVQASGIESRYFSLPLETIVSLKRQSERAAAFLECGAALGQIAVERALDGVGLAVPDIDVLFFTSCSMPVIPTLDIVLMQNMGFSPRTRRIPIFQYGCLGGAASLALAPKILSPGQRALIVSVELCSLAYQAGDRSGGNLVGSALFGDGAAAAVVSFDSGPQGGVGLRFLDAQSFVIPDSAHLMGYDLQDDGSHLRLDRELPAVLSEYAPDVITSFLSQYGLGIDSVPHWLFHPGGVKVLEGVERSLGLSRECLRWSWESLKSNGNLSSASVLFVVESFLKAGQFQSGDHCLVFGVGPGLALELILLQCQ